MLPNEITSVDGGWRFLLAGGASGPPPLSSRR
jgi:hypothetical protein